MTLVNFRNQQIDLLRGIAILLVLILHFHIAYHLDQSVLTAIFSASFIKTLAGNGNYGVTMFFVISGFLITSISLERYKEFATVHPLRFYTLRFARIMPCLLLVLTIIIFLSFTNLAVFKNKIDTTTLPIAILSVLTFWHNVLMEKVGYFNYCLNIYWSLSVEEVFYIVFPLLCLLLKKERLMILFWVALIIIAPIYRSLNSHDEIIALYGNFACFDAIAMGCIAAVITRKINFQGWPLKIMQLAAIFLGVMVYFYDGIMENVVFGISLIGFSTALLLIGAVQKTPQQTHSTNLFTKGICWFGKNSYELYLFHIVILALMKTIYSASSLGNYGKIIWLAFFMFTSVLVSGFVEKYYSQPLNKRIRNLSFKFRSKDVEISTKPT